jgi:hypothetical protein
MYPKVYSDFEKTQDRYGPTAVLPTPVYFYGLNEGQELFVDIEKGKTLVVRLTAPAGATLPQKVAFFPEREMLVEPAAPQKVTREGSAIRIEMKLADPPLAGVKSVAGVAVADAGWPGVPGKAIAVDAPVSATPFAAAGPVAPANDSGAIGGSVLTALFFVFAYVIFMAADGSRYTRAEASFGAVARPTVRRFQVFNSSVRRYYVVNASFGAVVAIIDGLALWALGVPAPAVWAILAFVTNFIPNIGFVIGLIPPALLALVVGGWPLMLAVVAIYCVVNVTLQVLVQPKFVSDAVSLSLTLSFFSVIFWTFIIGPLGAILSIPLTLLVRALVLEGDPGARWLRWLSGDAVPAAPDPGDGPD